MKQATKEMKAREGFLLNEAVQKLKSFGVDATPRQLRHWDRMGLLRPVKDDSGYRRFSYDEIDKAVFVFILNRMFGFSLERIRGFLVCLHSEAALKELLAKDVLQLMSKYRDSQGKERWCLKRELRDELDCIGEALNRIKTGIQKFDEMFKTAKGSLYNAAIKHKPG
ncbi:MAG: MerR family transcriptional regulator [Candidatus Omnitrophota bacterium]